MITCEIIVKSGKKIYIYNFCKYQSLKEKCYLIVCHYYNGKYFNSVMYLKWLHPVSFFFFHAIFEQPLTFRQGGERKLYVYLGYTYDILPQIGTQTNLKCIHDAYTED